MKKINIGSIVLLCVLIIGCNSQNKYKQNVMKFVEKNSTNLEELIDNEKPIPTKLTGIYYNEWSGEHPMYEIILHTYGNNYYGCYYSPDNVPLAFQNTDIELKRIDNNTWIWKSVGDNYGETIKIKDKWFYFMASF